MSANSQNPEKSDSSSDQDDSEKSADDESDLVKVENIQRIKRKVENKSEISMVRRVVWPPPSTSCRNPYYNIDARNLTFGNPKLGNKMQLFCKTGFFIGLIYQDGSIKGTQDDSDEYTFLERQSVDFLPENVKFQGTLSKLFIAMDKKGKLYGESNPNSSAVIFIESFHGSYNNYLSRNYAHLGWFMGIKKSGKFKKGPKTKYGQKAIKFLPRRTKFE